MEDQKKHLIERVDKKVLIGILVFAFACTAVWAQSTAQVSGTVRDQSGAVLPGVEVTATQTDTGLARNAVTNETGSYVLPNLPVGPYRLEATLPGFRTYVQTGIVLQVGSNPVINTVLEVGQVAETVEVQANAALVETRSTAVGQVIDNTRVLEMPLNGRQVTELIILSGAAVGGQALIAAGRNYPTQSISVGGGLNNGLLYLLDGGTHNDPYNNLNMPLPFPDALQEFKVETSALPAQYGQHSSAAVNAVTKSGTNEFHGDVFEFVRNKIFNARNAFAVQRDSLKRNQFGGVLGGPVIKNKLFFFGGDQTTFTRSSPVELTGFVPTPAMLAGDWTAITSPACNVGRQITLRAPFVSNRIDPALFSPAAVKLVKQYLPTPLDSCGTVHYGNRIEENEHIMVAKVDYQKTEKHSLFVRYLFARLDQPSSYDGSNILSLVAAAGKIRSQSLVLGSTYSIDSGTVNSFRATVLRGLAEKTLPPDAFFNIGDLGVKNYWYPGGWKLPQINVAGAFTAGSQVAVPGTGNTTVGQFTDDVSWARGNHQIGVGANYIHSRLVIIATSSSGGAPSFAATNTGMGMGDLMLGRMSQYEQAALATHYPRQNYFGTYLQDTWKANSRLTVNAGLRWEPYLSQRDKEGRMSHFKQEWFDQGLKSTVFKNAPAGLLYPGDPQVPNTDFMPKRWFHIAPRLGLAWDPRGDGRMTIRSAYGMFFDYPHLYAFNLLRNSPPYGARISLDNPVGRLDDPWEGYPGGNPFPILVTANSTFPFSPDTVNLPINLKMPYIHQWNLSVQRQIGEQWLASANYIGTSGIHVLGTEERNPAIYLPGASCVINGRTFSPCSSTSNTIQRRKLTLKNPTEGQYYGAIYQVADGGTRSYNGLLVSIQRRARTTLLANYTWAHCIDDGARTTSFNSARSIPERRRENRGNCDSDRRHNFNLSAVYPSPQFSNRTLRLLATGWRIGGILRIVSGNYLTINSGLDNSLTATSDRPPNQVLPSPYAANKSTARWLNPAAFAQPATGTYGTMGVSNVLGPGSITIDTNLTRSFQIRENQSVEFRVEAFNLPNHVNPDDPTVILTNARFGQILSAKAPRIIQLALKYVF
jgi:hypothetical protein